jgi:hypothetical protein
MSPNAGELVSSVAASVRAVRVMSIWAFSDPMLAGSASAHIKERRYEA